MLQFLVKRLGFIAMNLVVVSLVAFVIIELPPGDYLTAYAATLAASGDSVDEDYVSRLMPEKLKLDLEYVRTRSLSGDLRILWRTATTMSFGGGD